MDYLWSLGLFTYIKRFFSKNDYEPYKDVALSDSESNLSKENECSCEDCNCVDEKGLTKKFDREHL